MDRRTLAKRTTMLLWLLASALLVWGGSPLRRNSAFEQYIAKYQDIAIDEMHKYGIPASITLAQGLLESGAGGSELAVKGNNHFGIKCHGWQGRTIYHDDDLNGECFRAYDSPVQSFEDHSLFLARRDRYRRLFDLPRTDYKGWARGLKACGYATNPRYAQNLIDIIETYQLYRFDTAAPRPRHEQRPVLPQSPGDRPAVVRFHPIRQYNDNFYLVARAGDTFDTLAKETGIAAADLAAANERDRKDTLGEGDVVYLKPKAKRADKRFRGRPHTVRQGESLYTIAQCYGIRLKSLMKMNKRLAEKDWQVTVGDQIRVY